MNHDPQLEKLISTLLAHVYDWFSVQSTMSTVCYAVTHLTFILGICYATLGTNLFIFFPYLSVLSLIH